MALNANEIVIGGTGSIKVAPVGTAAPTDIATAWAAGWLDLGFASEDGVTFSDSKNVEQKMVWQQFYAARWYVTGREATASFVLEQWNETTVPLAFGGGSITTTAGPPIHYKYEPPAAGTIDERALGVEWVDGTKIYRLIVPRVLVTEAVETKVSKADSAQLPITCGIMGTDGTFPWYMRTNDPAWAA